jgi:hypothetical protein
VKLIPILSRWLLLWLRARKIPVLTDEEILMFLQHGMHSSGPVKEKIKLKLHDEHVKLLNLGHDWISSYLPFILQKVNRVHFGLLQPNDLKLLIDQQVKIPTSRKLVAVPFVAKDVPSRASEFAHPDVLIGLTILAYRYEGLRKKDFFLLMKNLRDCLEDEGGPYKDRPSFLKFEHWILTVGKSIRGSKKKPRKHKPGTSVVSVTVSGKDEEHALYRSTLFSKIFDLDDELIWPLQLIDPKDEEQFKVIYPLLYKLPHTVMYYLNDLIFPEVLAYQGLKLSACGQELGGDLLFSRKIGFSGTPSDILPLELGSCQYERGSDGKVIHYLTSAEIVSVFPVPPFWNAYSILDLVAKVSVFVYFWLSV